MVLFSALSHFDMEGVFVKDWQNSLEDCEALGGSDQYFRSGSTCLNLTSAVYEAVNSHDLSWLLNLVDFVYLNNPEEEFISLFVSRDKPGKSLFKVLFTDGNDNILYEEHVNLPLFKYDLVRFFIENEVICFPKER
eukprot:TRINITY_DN25543_c0_g1_i1.p1 TRINITY_DN25543_c0_g1~~TRINITY_DN25543_c0_g1_i1.p1  ORF type:complete len:136 (+),score=16.29 TRINITY_DN25543_c0_g1_i1:275-682(+)